jgi:hypothetical protein
VSLLYRSPRGGIAINIYVYPTLGQDLTQHYKQVAADILRS